MTKYVKQLKFLYKFKPQIVFFLDYATEHEICDKDVINF